MVWYNVHVTFISERFQRIDERGSQSFRNHTGVGVLHHLAVIQAGHLAQRFLRGDVLKPLEVQRLSRLDIVDAVLDGDVKLLLCQLPIDIE